MVSQKNTTIDPAIAAKVREILADRFSFGALSLKWKTALDKAAPTPPKTKSKKTWLAEKTARFEQKAGEGDKAYARRLFDNGRRNGRPRSINAVRVMLQRTKGGT